MTKKTKDITDSIVYALFQDYGKINKPDEYNKDMAYHFICDPKKLFKKDDLLSHMGTIKFLLLVSHTYECSIYAFRVGTSEGIKQDVLSLVNKANIILKYGKYILDSDDEIDWEFIIDLNYTTKEDISNILKDFITSLLNLAVDINEVKNKKINEKCNK